MPTVKFSVENLNERNQLEAAWYPAQVTAIVEGLAKDRQSTNYVTDFKVLEGKFVNTPIKHWFNEKFMGGLLDFVNCFMPAGRKVEPGTGYDLDALVGRKILVHAFYDIERRSNSIDDFKPFPTSGVTSVPQGMSSAVGPVKSEEPVKS